MEKTNCIFIAGIDGSGKTTLSEKIIRELKREGYDVRYIWMRYNHYLTKILLGFCKIIGLTKYYKVGNYKIGFHFFYKSLPMSYLFILFTMIDTAIATFFKISCNISGEKKLIVCDRYVVDILVDMMIDTKLFDLHKSMFGKCFIKLLKKNSISFYIKRNINDVLSVRPEMKYDPSLNLRLSLYEEVAKHCNSHFIDNNKNIHDAYNQIAILLEDKGLSVNNNLETDLV